MKLRRGGRDRRRAGRLGRPRGRRHAIDAVDTTGAGDAFDAGFLAAWLEGRPLDDALRLAVACGSLSTRASGGTDGQPTAGGGRGGWLRDGVDVTDRSGRRSGASSASRSTRRSTGSCPWPARSRAGSTARSSAGMVPGGKAANIVRAARHLGLPGAVVAVLGAMPARGIATSLAAAGIRLHAVAVDGETRTCLSVLDEAAGELTELYEAGVTLDAEDWPMIEVALADAALADDPSGTIVVLAGSLPPGTPGRTATAARGPAAADGARGWCDSGGTALAAALEAGRGS